MTRPARRGTIALVLAALPPSAGPAVWFSLPEPWGALAGFYGGWPGYGWGEDVYQYTEGTLNIDLVDARRRQLVWEGVAVGEVQDPDSTGSPQKVDQVVAEIFAKYPFRAGVAAPQVPDKQSKP